VWNYRKGNRILIIIKIFGRHKLVPTLRSGKVWQIWCFPMFLSILLPLSQNLTPSLCTTLYVHESRRWQTFSLFALLELVSTKNIFYPILLFSLLSHPKLLPLWSVPDRRTDGRTDNILHPLLPKFFFFPLSARGPTRRRNSTGLAQLWGGWPIELGSRGVHRHTELGVNQWQ